MIVIRARNTLDKHTDERLRRSVDLAPWLGDGESITGTPTVTADAESGLTFEGVEVVGTAVEFWIEAGTYRKAPWVITVLAEIADASPDDNGVWAVLCELQMVRA